MAASPARARADYDYLVKLLLIGDSGMHSFVLDPDLDIKVVCERIVVW
ncbi:hypothetical protein Hanom_Chr11g01011391 [Helianthus anomalus]